MNANPTPKPVSRGQLLTKPSFADLRGAKFFRCVRLVGAVGIEPTTFGLKGHCSTTELRPCRHGQHLTRKRLTDDGPAVAQRPRRVWFRQSYRYGFLKRHQIAGEPAARPPRVGSPVKKRVRYSPSNARVAQRLLDSAQPSSRHHQTAGERGQKVVPGEAFDSARGKLDHS